MLWGFIGALLGALVVREVAAYLPLIADSVIKRSARRLSEPDRTSVGKKWLETSAKIPGGLTKLLWALLCNRVARQYYRPPDPKRSTKLARRLFFLIYLRLVFHDFLRLDFASPRQLIVRWRIFHMFLDQSLAIQDPKAPQPIQELIEKLQGQKGSEKAITALQAALQTMRQRAGQMDDSKL
jgi:hypothetical protein